MNSTQLIKRIQNLSKEFAKSRNRQMKKYGLTSMQGDVMRYILFSKKEEVTAADVVQHLGRAQSNVAGVLERLEEKKMITREISIQDARKSIIRPTEKGMGLHDALNDSAVVIEQIMRNGMSDLEYEQFLHLLDVALQNLKDIDLEKEGVLHD